MKPGSPHIARPDYDGMVRELAGKPVVLDVETVGIDPWGTDSRLRMVQLAGEQGKTWVDLQPGDAVRRVVDAAPVILGHNVTFDLLWLDRHGLITDFDAALTKTVDTMTLAHLHDNRIRAVSGVVEDEWDELDAVYTDDTAPGQALKGLATHHLGPGADIAERRLYAEHGLPSSSSKSWESRWAAIPDDDQYLIAYAAADCDLVWRLLPYLRARVGEAELVEVERRGSAIAARMMRRGFAIDTDQVERARVWARDEEAFTRPRLAALGITTVAATGRGRDQAERALLEAGAPLTKRTESGAYSLSRDVLEGLAREYPVADWLHRARRAERFQQVYLAKMIDNRGVDGRLRPSISTMRARTGRWTIGGALPMQQMPRVGGFRECFAADPGTILVGADYSAVEFHTLGVVTGDEAMLTVSRNREDPYVAGASVLWPDEDPRAMRNLAKPFVLALGYGMGPAALAAKTGRTLQEATARRNQLRKAWPSPSQCMDRIGTAYRRGVREIQNPFGRTLQIPQREGRAIQHQALNHLNQGTARDLMMRDLLAIEDAGLTPWLTIHDEVIVQVDQTDAKDALRTLLNAMNHELHEVLGIPINANGAVLGKAWKKT